MYMYIYICKCIYVYFIHKRLNFPCTGLGFRDLGVKGFRDLGVKGFRV